MGRITLCISDINRWMLRNKLRLNQDKTEFFVVVASPRVLNLVSNIRLSSDGTIVKPSISVKNLGVTFDSTMNMSIHMAVTYVKQSIFISAICGEYAVSSPKMLVVMPSEHLSCLALIILIRFCLVLAKLISNGCNGYRTSLSARLVFAYGRDGTRYFFRTPF